MRRVLPLLVGTLLLGLTACSDSRTDPLPSASRRSDAGTLDATPVDVGRSDADLNRDASRVDAAALDGGGSNDAGVVSDSGASQVDAGFPDAGMCQPEADAVLCARLAKNCGELTAADNCFVQRTVVSCGVCTPPQTCGGTAFPNVCGCNVETDAQFCMRLGACGATNAGDNCGAMRQVDCGVCPPWPTTVIAPEMGGASDWRLVYDPAGVPHAVYRDYTDEVLRHAWRSPSGWQREIVDPDFAPGTLELLDLEVAVDATGAIHVAYMRADRGVSPTGLQVRHAQSSVSGWQITTVATPNRTELAIAIGANDEPMIAYRNSPSSPSANTVALARRAQGQWTSQTVSSWTTSGNFGRLAIYVDGASGPWLAFQHNTAAAVFVAQPAMGGWSTNETPMRTWWGDKAFVVDAAGAAHLIGRTGNQGLDHVFGGGIFWSNEVVTGVEYTSAAWLALDGATLVVESLRVGQRTAGMTRYKTFDVQIARRVNNAWMVTEQGYDPGEDVRSSSSWGPVLSGFDPGGEPVLLGPPPSGYIGIALTELAAAMPVAQPIDLKEHLDRAFDLAVGPDDRARVVYQGTVMRLSREDVTGWRRDDDPDLPRVSTFDFQVDSQGLEHVAYPAWNPMIGYEIRLASVDVAGNWTTQVAGSSTLQVRNIALAFGPGDTPHIAFNASGNLMHTTPAMSGWSVTMVASSVDAGRLGLVVDANDAPYIAYPVTNGSNIDFARLFAGNWQTTRVAYDGNFYGFAMALDAADRPCILHAPFDATLGSYATQLTCLVSGLFASTVITPNPHDIIGVARDGGGNMHVLVRRVGFGSDDSLVLMNDTGGAWVEEGIGDHPTPKFTVDGQGVPRMLYFDTAQLRLRQIHR